MTPSTGWILATVAVCASLVPFDAAAQPARESGDRTLAPYFFVDDGNPAVDRLPLKDTRVDVSIAGAIADVTVRQVYENAGERPLHARYVFPASTRAAVYGMTMTVGKVRSVARIRERRQASREFERAKQEGKSASLLEQNRPNVFTMNVADVLPGDTIAVELKYTELLTRTEGQYEFVFPTVVGSRHSWTPENEGSPEDAPVRVPYTHQGVAPRSRFHLAATISTGVPIQGLASPSHQMVVRAIGQGRAEVALADSERLSGTRDFILRYRLAGTQIGSGLLLYEGQDENVFLLMAEPPKAVTSDQTPPREYVFVIDVSGSMGGFPLETARKLMGDLVNGLQASDMLNVIVFADGIETLSHDSVPATRANLARALEFIGQNDSGGGTRLGDALERAVNVPRQPGTSRSIVLLTDGHIQTEADVFDYVRGHLDAANFFAFGVGSSVNRFLIEGIARAGLGEPFVVTTPGEAAQVAGLFRRYIDSPALNGIDVTFQGFDTYDVEPKTIPDLFGRPIVLFGKWRGSPGGSIEITGNTGHGLLPSAVAVTPESSDGSHGALRHLWARTRLANLPDAGRVAADGDRVAEITSLGLTYGVLTRYTSFVAVRENVRRTVDDAVDVDQPLPLPAGVSHMAERARSSDGP